MPYLHNLRPQPVVSVYDFNEFLRRVDTALKHSGLTHADIADFNYYGYYKAHITPYEAAKAALAANAGCCYPATGRRCAPTGCGYCNRGTEHISP
ncbi:hypothetical protein A5791_19860 [Mycobacterium sp. 852002-51163_SCH5372311]|uniref:hypothetical protein n=1 Tax=Mycobacterium sp. 852002-51163_SCH5372311 TaxID=1834097 RepID=UPI0007FEE4E1|nr:hypothetical protein [Mycobacterium sp. 852002-51163_SCH5372311]OBF86954.1 hypothetical protein A5791_19860 [Mycobacterium sp. 852002-51163_SCH5372311]